MFKPAIFTSVLWSLLCSSAFWESSPAFAQTPSPAPFSEVSRPSESPYDTYMRLGFAAIDRKDYDGAANYFRNALFYVPEDREATIAYWNARKALHNATQPKDRTPIETAYDRYMRIGYAETRQRDYQSALVNFERALKERPNDYWASQAIRNVASYIAAQKGQPLSSVDMVAMNVSDSHYVGESAYDRYMRLGYAAAKEKNYAIAADYFLSAIYERPEDRLATIAFWNMKHNLNQQKGSRPSPSAVESYSHYMRLGYDATQRHHFQEASTYFQAALRAKPGDEYATQAMRNVQTYIRQGGVN